MKRINLFFLALTVTVLLLFANWFVRERMNTIIKEDKLVDAEFLDKGGTPPLVSFTTVALGGFRGLIADILWLRLIALQDEGKYFEMVQLADWVQKLQPKFAGVSAYLGWNMAYNISVTCKRPEDRWRWIHRGIETLRSAIAMSPNDPELYKELGWIYQHKMGNVMDDAQRYYKYEMARDLLFLYGTRYPDWQTLADAPVTEAGFLEMYPATPESKFWETLRKAGYEDLLSISQTFRLKGQLPENLRKDLPEKDAAALDAFLRAKWMRERYILDPKEIVEINKEFGDLDWLIPETMALYWAYLGIKHSPKEENVDCDRMIVQSLTVSFTNGRILLPNNQASMNFILVPNPAVAPSLKKKIQSVFKSSYNTKSFRDGYGNFLKDAIVILFSYGRQKEAYEYYEEYCKEYSKKKPTEAEFLPFVLAEWEEDLRDGGYKQGYQQITALITRACELLAYGDREASAAHLALAKRAYDNYCANFTEDRLKLPSFSEMKRSITLNIMENFPDLAARLKAELESQEEDASGAAAPAGTVTTGKN